MNTRMTIAMSVLALMITLLSLPAFAQQATQWVLPAESLPAIQAALTPGKPLAPGVTNTQITIKSTEVLSCYRLPDSAEFCVRLVHPEGADAQGIAAGPFVLLPDTGANNTQQAAYFKAIAARLVGLSQEAVWKQVAKESVKESKVDLQVLQRLEKLLSEAKLKEAAVFLDEQKAKGPLAPELSLIDARLLALRGQSDAAFKAIADVHAALGSESSKQRLVAIERAKFELIAGNIENGLKLLDALPTETPQGGTSDKEAMDQDPRCRLYHLADQLVAAGKRARALSVLEAAARRWPQCATLFSGLSEYLLDDNHPEKLLGLLAIGLQKHPEDEFLLLGKANALRRLWRTDEALELYEKLYRMTKDERYITFHSTVASTQLEDARYDRFLKRLEQNPDDLLLMHVVGVMSYYLENYELSKQLMDRLRPQLKEDPRVYIYGAMSRYELGDSDGCRQWLDELRDSGREYDPDLHYCYAILYSHEDIEKSKTELDKYLASPATLDDMPSKRNRAIKYRAMLNDGNIPWAWIPSVHRPIMPPDIALYIAIGIALVLGGAAMLIIRRKRKKQ